MNRLINKVAVITGGNSGIGLASAEAFLREGATVVITGRDEATLTAAQKRLGTKVTAVLSDAAKLGDIDALMAAVKAKHGRIDVLFLNAGIAQFAPLEASDEAFFDRQFSTNVKGMFFTIKRALPLLASGASVILTSSVAASVGIPNSSVYSMTKAAVRNLARTLSAELVDRGIRVNVISPGPIETPIFGRLGLPQEAVAQLADQLARAVPMKRVGKADEVASVAVFMASDESSYMAGSEVIVSGGQGNL
ncbi:MAG: SDR family oxidoreductase [Phycisphaerales bacterium]|nr:SDR family oxidoreductase [Phycisphaerales bacterium]